MAIVTPEPDGGIKIGELSLFSCSHAGRSLFGGNSNMTANMLLEAAKQGKTVIWFNYEGPPLDTLAPKS